VSIAVKEFVWPVRVYYEDTDAGGVVYYANYLKFMERARTEWLRALGFEQDQLRRDEGVVFAVCQIAVDYMKPARFNQSLTVSVRLTKLNSASLYLEHTLVNEVGEAICQGNVKIACLDIDSFRPKPIPKSILAGLRDAN
jgi:acyl-CoA thioester hydrolase